MDLRSFLITKGGIALIFSLKKCDCYLSIYCADQKRKYKADSACSVVLFVMYFMDNLTNTHAHLLYTYIFLYTL